MSVPGLKKRDRKNGTVAWYWIARGERAVDYPTKIRRIKAADQDEAEAKAWMFQAEYRQWLSANGGPISFTGTMGSLIECYQSDEDSPYGAVRESTRVSYDHDLKILKATIGATRIAPLTRKDFARWHRNYSAPAVEGGERRVRRGHGLMTMIRGLLSFGVSMRYAGCKAAKEVLDEMTFEMPEPRRQAMTFAQATAIIDTAVGMNLRSIALGQALQFELGLRQIDVIGQWLTTADRDGGLVERGKQWTGGITWSDLTAERLAKRTSKTGQEGQWRPADYPLLVKVTATFAEHERVGPAIVSERTGKPYRKRDWADVWRGVARAAGVPDDVWNMDSRAGAVTEAHEAGAAPDDVRKFATHADHQTTQRYSRRSDEATSRVAKLRVELRGKDQK